MRREILKLERGTSPVTDITEAIQKFATGQPDGLMNVFAPHSTVGLGLAQLDDGSSEDIVEAVSRLIPRELAYHHIEKAPGHGADHILPLLTSPSLVLPIGDGRALLGAYQHVVFLDFDEMPSERTIVLTSL